MAEETTLTSMTPAQMIVVESFASVTSEEELAALMKVLKKFYGYRRAWEAGERSGEVAISVSSHSMLSS